MTGNGNQEIMDDVKIKLQEEKNKIAEKTNEALRRHIEKIIEDMLKEMEALLVRFLNASCGRC